ncbi:MAG TPA: segregation/condensation protein A [Candidatus Andersenbacteria bacterium]|nr:segregation/condensation protein A [Candidatus Andersenbacteria bacterium]
MMIGMQSVLPEVHIEQYEGPYDLLVELAKKEQVKLADISLKELTDSFLAYIKEYEINSEIIGSFLIVASTLLLIKARQMLPSVQSEEDEEVLHLRQRLAEYEKFREVSEALRTRWKLHELLPAHYFAEGEFSEPQNDDSMPDITSLSLAAALHNLIDRIPPAPQPSAHLTRRGRSLQEIFALFRDRLELANKLVFQETVHGSSRQDQALSFLAILEMARKNSVRLEQEDAFSTLTVHKL